MKIRRFVKDFPLVHLGIGIFWNATFLVGSVLFLWDHTQIFGVWLFIVGALGESILLTVMPTNSATLSDRDG